MATFQHASLDARVIGGGIDIGDIANQFMSECVFDTSDSTVINDNGRRFTFGTATGNFSLEGFLSKESSNGAADGSWDLLTRALKQNNVIVQAPAGDAVGMPGIGLVAGTVKGGTTNAASANVGVRIEGQCQGQPDLGVVAIPYAPQTALWNGATINAGAASTNVLPTACIAWNGFVGTTLTLKLQHSINGTTWADVATFPAITTAKGGARVEGVIGTLNQYRRIIASSGTFTGINLIGVLAAVNQPS